MKHIHLPLADEVIEGLRAGDSVLLSGPLYTGRDAAHGRFYELVQKGQPLPVDLAGQTIYYVGPAPARPGHPVGPAGPTSSYRMDRYTPALMELGLKGMIGKGRRTPAVKESILRHHGVYFVAIGGAAALLAQRITAVEPICYEDLGAEAVQRFTVNDFPVIVAIDCKGNDLYETEPAKYARE